MRRLAITGAAGKIGSALSFSIGAGHLFGPETEVSLRLIDVPGTEKILEALTFELGDGNLRCLKEVHITTSYEDGFRGAEWVILVGGSARSRPGMTRADLLVSNGKTFADQGHAIERFADPSVRILVVANPCNTNAWMGLQATPSIPKDRWLALSRLDENRARHQVAKRLKTSFDDFEDIIVWGNHSPRMYPDVSSARWEGKRLTDLLSPDWIRNELVSTVRGRADTLLSLRGYDSLHSVVIAIIDTIRDLEDPRGGFHSVGVYTDGQHGIKGDLIFSMPTRIRNGQLEVAENWVHSAEATKILEENIQELEKEKEVARRLLES